MARIKICGLKRAEDIEIVNELKPDYIGFILSSGFKRSIDFDTACRLRKGLLGDIKVVGVFVNDTLENIERFANEGIIDIVQLHGEEETSFAKSIRILTIKVLEPDSFSKAKDYEQVCDYLLFDSGKGSGRQFDWSKMPKVDKPFFLAGGLGEDNIVHAIKTLNPYAVDLSSAVETDGKKDYEKIRNIIYKVRSIT